MNLLGNNSAKLNDIIFENKNKTYGAYEIRASYYDSLKKSLLFLTGLVSLLFGAITINNKMNAVSVIESPVTFDDPILKALTYTTPMDFTPIPEPTQNTNAAAAPKGAIGTTIIDNAIESNSVNIDNTISGVGTETATGTDPLGQESSTLTTIHVSNTSTAVTPTEIFVIVEEMPEFEGGVNGLMKYIGQNVVYPSLARELGKEGTVYVSFVVNEVGIVENVKVVRGIGFGCDEEVVRVVNKMPRWKKVGKNSGQPVKVRFNIPVSFRLR